MTDNLGGDAGAGDAGAPGADSGAGAPADFLSTLPTELRSEGSLKNFGGPDGHTKLAKSFTELNRVYHSRSMADMTAPADDTGRRAVLAKMGMAPPDGPDGYSLPDTNAGKEFRVFAHKHGLAASKAEAMFSEMNAEQTRVSNERKQRIEQRNKEMDEKLRSEWGAEYDVNKDLSNRGIEHSFGKEFREGLEITGFIHHPELVKITALVGRALKEGTLMTGSGPSGGPATFEGYKIERLKIEKEMQEMKAANKGRVDLTNPIYRNLTERRKEFLTKEGQAQLVAQAGDTQ